MIFSGHDSHKYFSKDNLKIGILYVLFRFWFIDQSVYLETIFRNYFFLNK